MQKSIIVFQSDFTYKEGAVPSMYGVVKSVDRELEIITGTHEIPKYDIWSASYRLYQYMRFWPKGTVFVSVVDPGVGTPRKASVAKIVDGYYVVTPDNGTLTHLSKWVGIEEIREIDESVNRLKGKDTEGVSIFHGRDLFSYCAARLASGIISFEGVGPDYPLSEIILKPVQEPQLDGDMVTGVFEIKDPNFGNLWTNIPLTMFNMAEFKYGDIIRLRITHNGSEVFTDKILFHKSFGFAQKGEPVIYNNEMMKIAVAVSEGSFSDSYNIGYGPDWIVSFSKI